MSGLRRGKNGAAVVRMFVKRKQEGMDKLKRAVMRQNKRTAGERVGPLQLESSLKSLMNDGLHLHFLITSPLRVVVGRSNFNLTCSGRKPNLNI